MKINSSIFGMALITILLATPNVLAQDISIKEETISLDTYGFGKPNPIPILSEDPKIIPYYTFEEYDHKAQKKDWKVVTLENDYIKVMVLPEIGGKVWGAIEKSTGEEFLYKNEVIKFRNIAMRGPWTSGGIEFNFGIIGHHPATATPVDYTTRTNTDGSVSCIVGNTDLPSNTRWIVEIRLEKDKAYFETNASWYNASPLTQSYYNWMTAAAIATNDLEFFIPGNAYVGHNGNAHSWPIDEVGRNLAMYSNNNFGPAKSYHVVGEYNDFFGGYYHDSKFGFGQWAPYEEMPGQKLWLWALSRSGGIWEDLLTDSDGQYIEFQAGRLFDQYSGGAINPISQVGFDPNVMDRWSEIWFPYKEIGGMVDASKEGVLNVELKESEAYIGLNALQELDSEINVTVNGTVVFQEKLDLNPMGIFSKSFPIQTSDKIEVSIVGTELSYSNKPQTNLLKRPFYSDRDLKVSKSEQLLSEGTEALEFREYALAYKKLHELIQLDPSHKAAHIKMAELEYRKSDYQMALQHANTVLKMDTYNSGANYMAGITYRALKDITNALEALGWAARDIKYRTVAYAQMAEIYLASQHYAKAKTYAQKALDFNTYNLNARKVLVLVARKQGEKKSFQEEVTSLFKIDPLCHFAQLEERFMSSESPAFKQTNEFSSETILGLALEYYNLGLNKESVATLKLDAKVVKNKLWMAYLQKDIDPTKATELLDEIAQDAIDLVFPYRRETLPVLEWANNQNNSWKFKYYLAQNYLAVGQNEKGKSILTDLKDAPDSAIFYSFRAKILSNTTFENRSADYEKALQINNKDWKIWEETIQFYLGEGKYGSALELSKKGYKKFPDNYNIGLAHAKALLNTGRFEEVLKVLESIQVLPYEHASESREIYERAHMAVAKSHFEKKDYKKAIVILEKSKEWPENIGVGKPYAPDEREQDFLLSLAFEANGETENSKSLSEQVIAYTEDHLNNNSLNHLYGLLALKQSGDTLKQTEVLKKLKAFVGEQNKKTQLAVAFYENDTKALAKLKSENVVPENLWELAAWASKK